MSGGAAAAEGNGGSSSARIRSLETVRRHIEAETTTDTDAICATVSKNVFFAVPVRTRGGQTLPSDCLLTDHGAVHDYYAARAGAYVVEASSQLRSLATDWYVFNESAATLRGEGAIGEVDATGRSFVVNSAILFPTATDGIRGEICITRHPFEDVAAGRVDAFAGEGQAAGIERSHAALQDQLFDSLLRGGEPTPDASFKAAHVLAIRVDDSAGRPTVHTGVDRSRSRDAFASVFAGALELSRVARVVTAWYAFAELVMTLETGTRRHLALLQSVDQGAFSGSFGYGWDEAQAGPS